MREAETNYRKRYLLVYVILLCAIGDDSQRNPARHLANKVDREQHDAAGDSQHLANQHANRPLEGIPRQ